MINPKTLVELLRGHAEEDPERRAYTFLADGEVEAARLTYGELDRRARAVAAWLQEVGLQGERALLLYPSGLDFVAAFLGCLYAGVVAVPAYPPRRRRVQPRLLAILGDCAPAAVLTTAEIRGRSDVLAAQSPPLAAAIWVETDGIDDADAGAWRAGGVAGDTLAFLQYTSGSTGDPKGAMVSHSNLLHNEEMIRRAFGMTEESVVVGWLPLYHDMGLIGNLLQPLYVAASCVLMSPMAFLEKPLRWLRAIDRYRATTGGGPNFAYDLCVDRVEAKEREGLDLTSWTLAFNGAEPVRASTLERFAEAFRPCGFRREAFYPCYGLAETTLLVTGGERFEPPVVRTFDEAALEEHRAEPAAGSPAATGRELVGSGRPWLGQEVAIVDPVSEQRLADGQVGEIWVRGPSVAGGYWQKVAASARDFCARPAGEEDAGSYLRTGDLGFLTDGSLFVTGRLKELVILRGRNLYPHDLEATAERSHGALRLGSSAAFSVDVEGGERLVLVMEGRRDARLGKDPRDVERVAEAVRRAIADEHEVGVHAVVLIRTGTLLKTSSGKIQRRACRDAYLAGELRTVGESVLSSSAAERDGESGRAGGAPPYDWGAEAEGEASLSRHDLEGLGAAERRTLLLSYLCREAARRLRVATAEIAVDRPLTSFGLDSLMAMELRGRLESDLGFAPELAAMLEGASLAELADEVLEGLADDAPEPIPATGETEGEHPLSYGQEALYFLHCLAPESPAYNVAAAARLLGELDTGALRRAFRRLVERHPALRTSFRDPHGEVTQEVHADAAKGFSFHVEEAAGWDEARWRDRLAEEAHRPFDLRQCPLLRVRILERGPGEHFLLLVVHHAVADFWSLAVLLEELGVAYLAEKENRPLPLAPLALRYSDYVAFERRALEGEERERLEGYWLDSLAGSLEPLDLATDKPRPPVQTWNGAVRRAAVPAALGERLSELAGRSGATLYMVLLAAFQALLHRYTGQRRILVGSPTAGRLRPELEGLVGYFVNSLVMRGDLAGETTWRGFLSQTRRTVLDAFRHQGYPFDLLVERLHPERGVSRSPIFQVLFTLQQAPRLRREGLDAFALGREGTRLVLGGLEWESIELETRAAQFELSLTAAAVDAEVGLSLQYNRDLFEGSTVERLLGHLRCLLESAVAEPERRLADLEMLAAAERRQLLHDWNVTAADYPRELCLHQLVEAQARRTPEAVAVVACEGGELSYGELEARAAWLAARLIRLGVGPDVAVGLAIEPSLDMVVALLGVLKAGGAYVPLDPAYPEERLTYMLEDACRAQELRLLVTRRRERRLLDGLAAAASEVLEIDAEPSPEAASGPGPPAPRGENLAYVIYTSGSTGKPKGVEIPHRAVVNFLASMRRRPGLEPRDVLLAVTTLAFDIAVLEIFLPLTVGARLVLAGRDLVTDGLRLGQEIAQRGVTVMQATPATWRLLLESGWRGRPGLKMLCGGEALPAELAARLVEKGQSLWNMYGPTETTIWSAVRRVGAGEEPVQVGGVIANTRLHVLDARLEAVPIGVPGEVWIGGDGLAWGYRGRPGLTAERFVPDPFAAELGSASGERLYRVGDLARYRDTGNLEFLGRVDYQVKVRGYRIELGEIEAALAGHPAVRQAVVVVHGDDPGDPRLVAYLVDGEDEAADDGELRRFLRHGLPDYMVPSAFVRLDELPLLPNGKVDRRALPAPRTAAPRATAAVRKLPRTELEQTLAELWCKVLDVEVVGLHDNFFDLGGHSLLAARLHRLLVERLERDDVTVVDLFQYPTIDALARRLAPEEAVPEPHRVRRKALAERMDVAIVGMAGRFPGARDVDAFWHNLCEGVESITFFTDDELAERVPGEVLADPRYVRARGVLDGAEDFDASFFGFTPREAEVMDPQHRLFLECAYEALENAGYDTRRYDGKIGLYVGVGMNTYLLHAGEDRLSRLAGSYQAFISNDKDFVPTRASYKLNLRGPSINVQTACSSSLVAVHLACQSLKAGESDMAMAGGVAVRVPQRQGYFYEEGGILSPDGHCRAFSKDSAGTVLGNGLGVVVLKDLERALAGGDSVLAVIKGSAINNDGSFKVGYTAPSVEGQEEVITAALDAAGVEPRSIGYVEAHGTGTELGDPIEVTALTQVFHRGGSRISHGGEVTHETGYCALGSVKTNVGHLDTAAGVAGLIKAVGALRHATIPPSLHFESANPKIPFAATPFFVPRERRDWRSHGRVRRAGVSSFGIGGTNAHVVLEEAPPPAPTSASSGVHLLLLSAKTSTALDAATRRLGEHLRTSDADLADVAFTLQVGRTAYEHRRFMVARDRDEAAAALAAVDPERLRPGRLDVQAAAPVRPGSSQARRGGLAAARRRVVFLFSGQGSQYLGMGRQLYDNEPVFKKEIGRCAELLQAEIGLDLREVLYPPAGTDLAAAAERLRETRLTQPALFAVEYALARLWMTWGVTPAAMAGHSIGEYVAACLAGVFNFGDALRLVAARGRMMQELPPGAMLAVGLGEGELLALLDSTTSLAAVNGPDDCVVSGPEREILALASELESSGVRHRRLHTSHAFHSSMMAPAVDPFVREVARLDLGEPDIPFVSNLTGTWITDEEATDPGYWGRHLAEPVRFADAVSRLAADPGIFLEVGPGHTLTTLARPQARGRVFVSSLPHPKDRDGVEEVMSSALGRLWQAGVEIDWDGFYFYREEHRRRLALPTYPFERKTYWVTAAPPREAPAERPALTRHDDVGRWLYAPVWKPSFLGAAAARPASPETWLLLVAGDALGVRLAKRLAANDRRLVTADVGELRGREGYAAFLEKLGEAPHRVVCAWPLDAPAAQLADAEAAVAALLALVQALAGLAGEAPVALDLVTRRAWRVQPQEAVEPAGAALWGLLEAVPQELRRLRCRSIDVDPDSEEDTGDLLDDLAAELETASAAERRVAWRGGGRWVRAFEPVTLPPAEPWLAPGAAYLVTGGLGGVGLVLARALVEATPLGDDGVRARLALVGRRSLPPREAWDATVAERGENDPLSRAIRGVRELEAAGAEVFAATADVADKDALAAVLEEARTRLGPIRGAIHAAGIAGGGLVETRSAAAAAAVLRPKVAGTRALYEALAGEPLDFLVLCSSINAVAGGFGQADYCAANAFLDAFAQAETRRLGGGRRGARILSLGWDRWRGVGMAAAGAPGHPLLGLRMVKTAEREVYRAIYTVAGQWVLAEHRIAGRPTVPGATYLEMARAAFAERAASRPLEIRDVVFPEPLVVDDGASREVLTVFDLEEAGEAARFRVLSRPAGSAEGWKEHCRGEVAVAAKAPAVLEQDFGEIERRMSGEITAEDAVARSSREFLVTGRRWQGLERVQVGEGELVAEISLPDDLASDLVRCELHPALLDIAVGYVQLVREGDYLPLSYERLRCHAALPQRFRSHLVLRGKEGGDTLSCDAVLFDTEGAVRVVVEGFSMKRLELAAVEELARMSSPANGSAEEETDLAAAILEGTVEPADAAEVLRRVLSAPRVPPHLVVSPRDLAAVQKAYADFDPTRLATELAGLDAPAERHDRGELSTEYVAPVAGLEKVIAEVWQRYLGVDEIGVHDNFFELGGTSLVGVQVVGELKRRLGREIATVSLFEAPSIKALAHHLEPPAEAEEAFAKTRSRASRRKAALGTTLKSRGKRPRRKIR